MTPGNLETMLSFTTNFQPSKIQISDLFMPKFTMFISVDYECNQP